jgi:type IV conjugative transfer system protein TraL
MDLEKFYIPKHLDAPPRFLLWSVDEAMSALIPVFLGAVMSLGIFTPIIAIISFKTWKKIKGSSNSSGGQGFVKTFIYWNYPSKILGLKATPDSAIKNYIA